MPSFERNRASLHSCLWHVWDSYYEQQIDPVQLFVFEQFLASSLFSEKRAEFGVATVKISIRP